MKFLVLADIDDLWWCGKEGQADVLRSCGDLCDDVGLVLPKIFTSSTSSRL